MTNTHHEKEDAECVDKSLVDACLVGKKHDKVTTSKYGITVQCPADIDSIKVQLQATQLEIRKLIHDSAKKQEELNRTLAEIYALTGKNTAKKALKSIINVE
eukprot:7880493-Ditylum_brightwellii.AAC.2